MSSILIYDKIAIFDHIIDNMYLGDINAVKDSVLMEEIDVVINVSNLKYPEFPAKKYFHLEMYDNPSFKIDPVLDQFDRIMEELGLNPNESHEESSHVKERGEESTSVLPKVLIHCMAGISRSVTLMVYYLMNYKFMTLKESFDLLSTTREQDSSPNFGFYKQLRRIEKDIFGHNSMTLQDYKTFF